MTPVDAIAVSGLTAATLKLNVSANNVANADDSSSPGAPSYQAEGTQSTALPGGGVIARAITLKPGSSLVFDPTSILAGPSGLVVMPEVDPIAEVASRAEAAVAFSAALQVFEVSQEDERQLLDVKS